MKNSCYNCPYFKEEVKEESGIKIFYCSDLDCYIDPTEPDCNESD